MGFGAQKRRNLIDERVRGSRMNPRRNGSAIFREANEVEMVVVIGQDGFGPVAKTQKELNIAGCS